MSDELRGIVLEALDHLEVPAGREELSAYARAFHGTALHTEDLAALCLAERRAWEAGERRDAVVCPAILDYPGFPPDDSLLTRSDWPLEHRVLVIGSEAVRQLWLAHRLCGLVLVGLVEQRSDVDVLVEEATRRAELLLPAGIVAAKLRDSEDVGPEPGVPIEADLRTYRQFVFWTEMAEDAHALLARTDLRARRSVAERVSLEASPVARLFGGDV